MRISRQKTSARLRLSSGFLLVLSTLGLGAPLTVWAQASIGFDITEAPTVVYCAEAKAPYPLFKSAAAACNYELPPSFTLSITHKLIELCGEVSKLNRGQQECGDDVGSRGIANGGSG
ncbi:MAG: hypothetical protein AB3X41_06770, partial [Leptothrix ochracea]|uniref:hypothetical protein n=1 Tax=Leptothrix ochracea TaxID=735331 RepID=UPI0034E1FF13